MKKTQKRCVVPFVVNILYVFFCYFAFSSNIYAVTKDKKTETQKPFQSLRYVVQKTLQQNPNVLESQAREMEANANLRGAKGGFYPQVNAQAAAGRGSYDDEYRTEIAKTTNEVESGVNIVQPLFSGLTTKNTVKQRRFEFRAASYNKDYTKEQMALQAINAYLEILRLQKLQRLALDNIKTHERILNKVKILYRGGGGAKSDVDLADGRLSGSKNTSEMINKSLQDAQAFFAKVVGEEVQRLEDPVLPTIPQNLLNFANSKNLAQQHHPAVLANQEGVKAAKAQVAVARGRLSPSLNFQLSANDNNNTWGNDSHNKDVRGMVVVSYNLFNGGSDMAAIDAATHNLSATLQKRDTVEREVFDNLANALHALNTDRARLTDLKHHVEASIQALDGYRKQFDLGRRSLLDVLNIEDELFNARADLLNGEYAVRNDTYALLEAVGDLTTEFK